ncbi:ESPR-type extended signal peptide-containing protein [Psychrobacter sp. HD31]
MNHVYKVIFNKSTGAFTAVSEFAKGHVKSSKKVAIGEKFPSIKIKRMTLSALVSSVLLALSGQVSAAAGGSTATQPAGGTLPTNQKLGGYWNPATSTPGTADAECGPDGNLSCWWTWGTEFTGVDANGTPIVSMATSVAEGGAGGVLGNGVKTSNTILAGVAEGIDDYDAVNVKQLNEALVSAGGNTYFHANDADATNDGVTNTTNYGKTNDAAGAQGSNSVAAGVNAQATNGGAVAIGYESSAKGANSFAVGENSEAVANNSIAIGADSKANTTYTTAIGRATNATGSGATAIGGGTASGAGLAASATGSGSVAIGGGYTGNAGAKANGKEAIAIGNGSATDFDESIALGANSIVTTDKNVTGVNPLNSDITADPAAAWTSTAAAVSVGDTSNADNTNWVTRQITGVAAGTEKTDAVNVAQLTAVANAPLIFTGNTNNDTADSTNNYQANNGTERQLNETLNIIGSNTSVTGLTEDTSEETAGDTYSSKNIQTVVTDGQVQIQMSTNPEFNTVKVGGTNPIVISDTGIDMGSGKNRKISNLAAGIADNDAVNVSQLKASKWDIAGNDGNAVADGVNKDDKVSFKNGNATTSSVTGGPSAFDVKYDVNVDDDTIKIVDNKLEVNTDAIASQTELTYKANNDNGSKKTVSLADGLDFTNGTNTTAEVGDNGVVKFNVTTEELAVADGKVSSTTSDAPASAKSIADAINNTGWNVQASADGGELGGTSSKELVQAGEDVNLKAGKNIKVTQAGQNFTFATKDDVEFNTVKVGGTNPIVISDTGIDMGSDQNRKISNLAAGTADNDAVNVSQLTAVAEELDKKNYFHVNKSNAEVTSSVNDNRDDVDGVGNATGAYASAAGYAAKATGRHTAALGSFANATATRSTATGAFSKATELNATATGAVSKATNKFTTATGAYSHATEVRATSLGSYARATGRNSTATGYNAKATAIGATATGMASQATSIRATANGFNAKATDTRATATGSFANSTKTRATANGYFSEATGVGASSIGAHAQASGSYATALGGGSRSSNAPNASGDFSTAIGFKSKATDDSSFAAGTNALASAKQSIAIGEDTQANGAQSISIGTGNIVNGNNSGAIGDPTTIDGNNSYSLGNNNNIAQDNIFVVGNEVTTTQANSVVLGNESTDRAATAETNATIGDTTYSGFAGVGSVENGIVSVGAAGKERQIINVAAGEVSSTSTDAINGSQLYAVANELDRETYFHVNGTGADASSDSTASADNLANVEGIGGATGVNALAAGINAKASGENSSSVGYNNTVENKNSQAFGNENVISGTYPFIGATKNTAVGSNNKTTDSTLTSTFGGGNTVDQSIYASTIGANNKVTEGKAVGVYGTLNTIKKSTGISVTGGDNTVTDATNTFVFGGSNTVEDSSGNIGIVGAGNDVDSTNTLSIVGDNNKVSGVGADGASGIHGSDNTVNNVSNVRVIGNNNTATADSALIFGNDSTISGKDSGVFGSSNEVSGENTFVVGNNVNEATQDNNVILGNNSSEKSATSADGKATQVTNATINDVTYGDFAGTASAIVSVGKEGAERQITNVAPGAITATSTDAINGSQLYAVANELDRETYFHVNGTGADASADPTASADNLANVEGIGGATGVNALAAGLDTMAAGISAVSIGHKANASAEDVVAIGMKAGKGTSGNDRSVLIGKEAGQNSVAVSNKKENVYIGFSAGEDAEGGWNTMIGTQNAGAGVKGNGNAGIGQATLYRAEGNNNSGLGPYAGNNSKGNNNTYSGFYSGFRSDGDYNTYSGSQAGYKATGDNNVALGKLAGREITADRATALGAYAKATEDAGVALGSNSVADRVAITNGSATNDVTDVNSQVYALTTATADSITAIENTAKTTYAAVSVGGDNGNGTIYNRQITNVAAGGADNDAVNVAQLKAVANAGWDLYQTDNTTANLKDNVKAGDKVIFADSDTLTASVETNAEKNETTIKYNAKTTDLVVNTNGSVNFPATADEKKLVNAKEIAKTINESGFTLKANSDVGEQINPGDEIDLLNGDNVAIERNGTDITINAEDTTVSVGDGLTVTPTLTDSTDGDAGVDDYKVELSQDTQDSLDKADSALQEIVTQIDGTEVKTLDQDDNVANFKTGDNIVLTDDSGSIKIATADEVEFTKVTVGPVVTTATGIDMGSQKITNLAAGTAGTDAVNVDQLKQYSSAATTEVVSNGNTSVTKETGSNGQTIYQVAAEDTTVSVGDGLTVTPTLTDSTDGDAGVDDYKVELSQDTQDSLDKADSALQEIVTQIDNRS